jgi:hypothetical protein
LIFRLSCPPQPTTGPFIIEFRHYGCCIYSTTLPNMCRVDPTQPKLCTPFINVISISIFVDNINRHMFLNHSGKKQKTKTMSTFDKAILQTLNQTSWTSLIKHKTLSGILWLCRPRIIFAWGSCPSVILSLVLPQQSAYILRERVRWSCS